MSAAEPLFGPVACPICDNTDDFAPTPGARVDPYVRRFDAGRTRSTWVVCRRCGMVMQNPRPVGAAYDRLYAGGSYHAGVDEAEVEERLAGRELKFGAKIDLCARLLRERGFDDPSVLDIGCGIGDALAGFRERGFRVTGISPDPNLCEVARRRLGLEPDVEYFGPGRYPSGSFTLVFSNHVFEHLDEPFAVARAIADVLAPGAICFTAFPSYEGNRSWGARLWMNSAHNWLFSRATLGALFRRAGLRVIDVPAAAIPTHVHNIDEQWLVVEKPRGALAPEPLHSILRGLPSADSVERDLRLGVPLRSALYLPWLVGEKLKRVASATGGDPAALLGHARRVIGGRIELARSWMGSFR